MPLPTDIETAKYKTLGVGFDTIPVPSILKPLSLIASALCRQMHPDAVREAGLPFSHILVARWEQQGAEPGKHPILPFPDVSGAVSARRYSMPARHAVGITGAFVRRCFPFLQGYGLCMLC
jgi:hypothetical protein